MGLFSRDDALPGPIRTVVGAGTVLHGDVVARATVRVDGEVDGDVSSEDGVIVGEGGIVRGSLSAPVILVAGRVDGHVAGSRCVRMLPGGAVHGDIRAPKLIVADGVVLDGRVDTESKNVAARTRGGRT